MKFSLSNFKLANGALDPAKMAAIAQLNGARAFVETGTYLGDTVYAMRDVFEKVYSIELSEDLYGQATERFSGDPKVKLLLGDSSEKLQEAARLSSDPAAVFWLDAHWSGGNTARAEENTPIVSELKSILSCDLEQPIMIVDDMRYFVDIAAGFDVHEANYGYPLIRDLLAQVRELWPNHVPVVNGDLLFIFPERVYADLEISKVLSATSVLRCGDGDFADRLSVEATIAAAEGDERGMILALPEVFKDSLNYGIGGEYVYWRGLVHERDGAHDLALADFEIARKCGLTIPQRRWE
ncbi:hypothetical protein [Rhizobium sp. 18055]|uniref:hypothetical protein n=1 Tax=Rhizobium sp. 18055 TaxID=2681403 RepID=UPI001358B8B5|nr:hypothetical protein [Rhizobium sp. 18055]